MGGLQDSKTPSGFDGPDPLPPPEVNTHSPRSRTISPIQQHIQPPKHGLDTASANAESAPKRWRDDVSTCESTSAVRASASDPSTWQAPNQLLTAVDPSEAKSESLKDEPRVGNEESVVAPSTEATPANTRHSGLGSSTATSPNQTEIWPPHNEEPPPPPPPHQQRLPSLSETLPEEFPAPLEPGMTGGSRLSLPPLNENIHLASALAQNFDRPMMNLYASQYVASGGQGFANWFPESFGSSMHSSGSTTPRSFSTGSSVASTGYQSAVPSSVMSYPPQYYDFSPQGVSHVIERGSQGLRQGQQQQRNQHQGHLYHGVLSEPAPPEDPSHRPHSRSEPIIRSAEQIRAQPHVPSQTRSQPQILAQIQTPSQHLDAQPHDPSTQDPQSSKKSVHGSTNSSKPAATSTFISTAAGTSAKSNRPVPGVNTYSDARPHRCPYPNCEWSFARSSDQRRHIRSHEQPILRCPYWEIDPNCHRKGGAFHRLDVLKRHLKLVHFVRFQGTDSGWCRVCSEMFPTGKHFLDHCSQCAQRNRLTAPIPDSRSRILSGGSDLSSATGQPDQPQCPPQPPPRL